MRWKLDKSWLTILAACVALLHFANYTKAASTNAGWTISLSEPPAKVVPVETLASWTIDVSPPVAAPALSWSIDVGPVECASPIALVSAWAIPLCGELCDCDGCKCESGKCQCCIKDKVPVPKEPTVASLLGQRLEYGKAKEIAGQLRCPLIAVRGLDAATTERWATEAQRRRALFTVASQRIPFDHDGAFLLSWYEPLQAVGVVETLEKKIVESPPMIVSQPWIQPAYFFGSACAGGNCPR